MDTRTRQGAFTDRGGRTFNEDAFLAVSLPAGPSGLLFLGAVADGVGGQVAGKAASSYAVKVLQEFFERRSSRIAPKNLPELLRQIFYRINSNIHGKSSSEPRYAGMGTTLTCLLASRDNVTIAHVGDTRAYIKRGGRLFQITRDHLVEEASGEEVDERFALFEEEPVLIGRVLGAEPEVEVDIYRLDLEEGDVFLLASDGVYRDLDEEEMAQALEESEGAEDAARRLVEAAISKGASDNVTAVVWEARELEAAVPEETLPEAEEAVEEPAAAPAGTGRFALSYQSLFEGMAASGGVEELERLMDLALERELMEGRGELAGATKMGAMTAPAAPAEGTLSEERRAAAREVAMPGEAMMAPSSGLEPSQPPHPESTAAVEEKEAVATVEVTPMAPPAGAPTAQPVAHSQEAPSTQEVAPQAASTLELRVPEPPPAAERPSVAFPSDFPRRGAGAGVPDGATAAAFPAGAGEGWERVASDMAVPEEAASVIPMPLERAARPSRRRWKAAVLASALILLLVGAIAAFTLFGGKKGEQIEEGVRSLLEVPALKGLTVEEAAALLDSAGIEYQVKEENDLLMEKGRVIKSIPDEGQPLAGGQRLTLLVSLGPPAANVTAVVPDVTGMPRDEAVAALQAAGFNVAGLSEAHDQGVPEGHVCSQEPPPGAATPPGTAVSLVISLGPEQPAGPQLVTCPTCGGSGKVACSACGGRGTVTTTRTCSTCGGTGINPTTGLPCSTCGGSGRVTTSTTCSTCGGTGRVTCPTCGGRGKVAR